MAVDPICESATDPKSVVNQRTGVLEPHGPPLYYRYGLVASMEEKLMTEGKECAIIPTGHSGSGKSYTARHTLKHLLRNSPLGDKAEAALRVCINLSI